MGGLWPLVWRSLRARRLRAALTVIAVALGVAAILGVQVALAALDDQAMQAQRQRAGASDLDVRSVTAAALGEADMAALRRLDGVAEVEPFLEKPVTARVSATAILAPTVSLVAVGKGGQVALRPVYLLSGRLPAPGREDEVALDAGVAQVLAATNAGRPPTIGDTVRLTTTQGPDRFRVVGIADGTSGGLAFTRSAVYVPLRAAIDRFGMGLRTPLAAVRLRPGADPVRIAAAVQRRLGSSVVVADPRAQVGAPLRQQRPLLAVLAVLSVVIGAGVTANSVAVSALERRREVGLLRVAGASRRQVVRLFLAEAAFLAAGGAALGVVTGIALGAVLVHLFTPPGISVPPVVVAPQWAAAAVVAGGGAAVVASAVPALAARRLAPIDALRIHPVTPEVRPRRTGLILAPAAAGVFAAGAVVGGTEGAAVGTLALLVAVALVLPYVAPPLARILATVLSPFVAQAPVAAVSLLRHRHRTAVTEAALAVAVAAATAIAVLTASALQSADHWVDNLFVGDVVVASPATQPDPVATALARESGAVAVSPVRYLAATLGTTPVGIAAIDPVAYARAGALQLLDGDRTTAFASLGGSPSVVVPGTLAEPLGWRAGDRLSLHLGGTRPTTVTVTVAAVVAHSLPSRDGREAVLIGRSEAQTLLGPAAAGFDLLQVVSPQGNVGRVGDVAGRYGMRAVPVSTLRSAAGDALDHAVSLLAALAWLAVGVALLAVVNTVAVNVRLQARELALLRAVGLSRRQTLRLLLAETALLVLVGASVGVAAGYLAAVVLLRASSSPGFDLAYVVPVVATVGTAAAILLLALIATLGPGRRTVRASIVAAIRYE